MRLSPLLLLLVSAPAHAAPPTRVKAARRDVHGQIGLSATVAPRVWTELTAPVAGTISDVRVDLGDTVKRGQSLADVRPDAGGATRALTAPYDGVVVARSVHPGAHVAPGGMPIVTVIDDSRLRVLAEVPEVDTPLVRVGQDATVVVAAHPNHTWTGKVARLGRELSAQTHTLPIEIDVDNADRKLLAGMAAHLHIQVAAHANALTVPRATISLKDGAAFVFRDAGGRARRVPVALGFEEGDFVEVTQGLADGDEVLLADHPLSDGETLAPR